MPCGPACFYLSPAALPASSSLQGAPAAPWDQTYETPCYTSLEKKSTLLAMSNFMFVPATGSLITTIPTHATTVSSCTWYSFVTIRPRFYARTEQAFPSAPSTMYPCPDQTCLSMYGHASL